MKAVRQAFYHSYVTVFLKNAYLIEKFRFFLYTVNSA